MIKKQFIVTENAAFRLRVEIHNCLNPADLNNINFVQETIDNSGTVIDSSTYNFLLTNNEISTLARELTA